MSVTHPGPETHVAAAKESFRPIAEYRHNPVPRAEFLELDLRATKG